ncbi:MAG: ubiquinone biosynthesis regulatory protein kinase UbiB [Gammaproteobacteria bacterium]|nr:ubiquinone biosynthesis regulatory protein kinase UbiB [Gammaproteobacteria bacterium]MDD9824762.1 ubiquinone biosynthesis regulatory protein kinase UbiB [Gammaproteobacteria bacterium]
MNALIQGCRYFFRLLYVQRLLVRQGLDEILLAIPVLRRFSFARALFPWNWRRRPYAGSRGERLRGFLEELGPIYVKLGQILSTRRDLLPGDIAEELAKLQDRVPPFPSAQARKIIEAEYGKGLEEIFADFQDQPLASASIAQVHTAVTKDGREVVVKVVRPAIRARIETDLRFMYLIARFLERYWGDAKRLKPYNVVRELHRHLIDELDLMREAANASQLRRNFLDSELLYVPYVVWELTTSNVMVMERISGIPIGDREQLRAAGIDLRRVAEQGVEMFFTQVFRDSFFHADLHPGNIFVLPGADDRFRFALVDFGIMSSLSEGDLRYLAGNCMAFLDRDYQRIARLHVESGWVPQDTRIDAFESAVRTVCEPMLGRPVREISFGQLLLRLFQTARRFNMEILPQLLLLQKTIVNVEGLGRYLYPNLNMWDIVRPMLERWMRERMGLRRATRDLRRNMPLWLERLPDIPIRAMNIVNRLDRGALEVVDRSRNTERIVAHMERSQRATRRLGCGLALLVLAFFSLAADDDGFRRALANPWTAALLAAAGTALIASGRRGA